MNEILVFHSPYIPALLLALRQRTGQVLPEDTSESNILRRLVTALRTYAATDGHFLQSGERRAYRLRSLLLSADPHGGGYGPDGRWHPGHEFTAAAREAFHRLPFEKLLWDKVKLRRILDGGADRLAHCFGTIHQPDAVTHAGVPVWVHRCGLGIGHIGGHRFRPIHPQRLRPRRHPGQLPL